MKYYAKQITNPDHKDLGKFASTYLAKRTSYVHNTFDTMVEAQEDCLIQELQDKQHEMYELENKLCDKYGWSHDMHADKFIGNLLA